MSYFVQWEIEINANSPLDAAYKAWEIIRAEKSLANVFTVYDENGESFVIDLQEQIFDKQTDHLVNETTET